MTGSAMLQVTILVAVLGTAAGAIVPLAFRAVEHAEERAVADQLDRLEGELLDFYRVNARFPKKSEFESVTDPRGGQMRYRVIKKTAVLEPRGFPGTERRVSPLTVDSRWSDRALSELEILRAATLRYEASTQKLPKKVSVLVTGYVGSDYRADPWGRDYRIDRSARTITSDGPDRKRRTADDLIRPLE